MKHTWIWNKKAEVKNAYIDFARDFDIDEIEDDAKIMICADTEYAIYLNGAFVGCGQYGDFRGNRTFDTISVKNFLRKGTNRLCITVYYQGESSHSYSVQEPGLWYFLKNGSLEIESNKETLCAVNNGYKQGEIFKTTMQLCYGWEYNASLEDEWMDVGKPLPNRFLPSSEMGTISPSERPVDKLVIKKDEPMDIITQGVFIRKETTGRIALDMHRDYLSFRPYDEIFDEENNIISDDIYLVVDLHREMCGCVSFSLDAPEGTVIDIAWGEHLEDLRVRSAIGGRNFANRYICREGKQTFNHYHKRIAGRYLELHISGRVRRIENIGLKEAAYPVGEYMKFKSNDSLHNRIFEVCRDTLISCMHDHYEDCPWREQALFAGDARNQMLCGYYAFREFKFPRASLTLIGKSVEEDGLIKMVVPSDDKAKIPAFTFYWLMSMREYAEHSGDLSLAREFLPTMRKMVDCYKESVNDGVAQHPLKYWCFYEWSEGCDGKRKNEEKDGLYQLYLYEGLKSVAYIAKALNDAKLELSCMELMNTIYDSVNRIFWNEEKKLYATFVTDGKFVDHYCELMQIMAVFTGIAGDKADMLCKAITQENSLIKSTLMCAVFKYDALLRQDKSYDAYVYGDIAKRWGAMLYKGATTFWETEDGDKAFDNAGSLCHAWSAIPLYIYGRYGMGITSQDISEGKVKKDPIRLV